MKHRTSYLLNLLLVALLMLVVPASPQTAASPAPPLASVRTACAVRLNDTPYATIAAAPIYR